jgi:hypothetical protein
LGDLERSQFAAASSAPQGGIAPAQSGKQNQGLAGGESGEQADKAETTVDDLWALEGVRSLPFEFDTFLDPRGGEMLSLRSLGHEPHLDLSVVHQPWLRAVSWALATLVVGWGVVRTHSPASLRLRWLVAGFLLTAFVPLVMPWNYELGTLLDHLFGGLTLLAIWYLAVSAVGWLKGRIAARLLTQRWPNLFGRALLLALVASGSVRVSTEVPGCRLHRRR